MVNLMPTSEEELQMLRAEVARLKAERDRLAEIKRLKLERLQAKLGNLYPNFQAQHPYLTGALGYLGRGAKTIGQNAVANSNDFIQRPVASPQVPYKANKMVSTKKLKKFIAKPRKKAKREEDEYWENLSEAFA